MLLEMMLEMEAPSSDVCYGCGKKALHVTLYRCRNCLGGGMLCGTCCVVSHRRTPFHHLEKWTGCRFERASLAYLGLNLYLGHGGAPCSQHSAAKRHNVRVVDSNGSQVWGVYECCCSKARDRSFAQQLMSMGLFPGTHTDPRTAFTFRGLKDFQIFNFCGKMSIWDYFETIRRKSNGINSREVAVSSSGRPEYAINGRPSRTPILE